MTTSGTRNPSSYELYCGGATWSYQPPQSSHVKKIAVSFQYRLSPIALTTAATHEGPVPFVVPAWSDAAAVGVTQTTSASRPAAISVRIVLGGATTRVANSLLFRRCTIASGACQSPAPR